MQKAPIPPDDNARLDSVRGMNLLDTPAEYNLDRIVGVTAAHFDAPVALFTIVDEHRQWFKSRFGLTVPDTPRDISFCGHAIVQDEPFVIGDATKDDRFLDNPLVTDDPKIKFYAGVPIKNHEGHNIGTLCIIDRKPRSFSTDDRARLQDFGWWLQLAVEKRELSESQLELMSDLDEAKHESMTDPMTQTWNRRGFSELAVREIAKARRTQKPMALAMIDIDHFKRINDTYGHPEGDKAIILLTRLLRSTVRITDVLARLGGEEFAILMPEISQSDSLRLGEKLRLAVEQGSSVGDDDRFTVSVGIGWFDKQAENLSIDEMVAVADKALYTAKQSGRNRVVMNAD